MKVTAKSITTGRGRAASRRRARGPQQGVARGLVATGVLACVLAGATAPASRAQSIGVPVTDVVNLAFEVAHNMDQDDLTEDVLFKVLEIYLAMRKLDDLGWRDVDGPIEAMRLAAEAGEAFGYGREDIALLLAETFPGEFGYAEDWYIEKRGVVEREMQTVQNYAANLRTHYESWEEAHERIEFYRDEIESLLGVQEAYDVLLALGVFETDEWRLVRQMMMQDLTLQAVVGSDDVNEKVQRMRTLRDSLKGVSSDE